LENTPELKQKFEDINKEITKIDNDTSLSIQTIQNLCDELWRDLFDASHEYP
jgi:hypothetical protein